MCKLIKMSLVQFPLPVFRGMRAVKRSAIAAYSCCCCGLYFHQLPLIFALFCCFIFKQAAAGARQISRSWFNPLGAERQLFFFLFMFAATLNLGRNASHFSEYGS